MPEIPEIGLFAALPLPVVAYDAQTLRFVGVNDAACALYGWSREEFLELTVLDIRPPEDVERLRKVLGQVGPERRWTGSWTHRDRGGRVFTVDVLSHEVEVEGRQVRISVVQEHREWVALGRRARSEEKPFRALVEHASDVVLVVDREGRPSYVGRSAERVFGLSAEELMTQRPMSRVHPDDLPMARARLAQVLEQPGIPVHTDIRFLHADGRVLHLEAVAVNRLDEPEIGGIVINMRDVTEAERARAQLDRFFELSADLMAVLGSDGSLVRVNPALERLLGRRPHEVVGTSLLDHVHPEDHPRVLGPEGLHLAEASLPIELRMRHADGSWRLLAWTAVETTGEVYAVARDVTRSREMESQLRQTQKLEAVGRLAGGIAHDFNNMLTVIRGFAELAMVDLPSEGRARRDVQEIERAAERAADLTRQLLAFSRRQVLQPRAVDLEALLQDMRRMLERLLGADVRLEVDAEGPLPRVQADPAQVEQVIMNLAVNAREAMPGGGELSIRGSAHVLEPAEARLRGLQPGAWIRVDVVDTGHGMDELTRERVFEPFFTTKEEGTGLGLATVHGIVQQSGGQIEVDSVPGIGTTFRIWLPTSDGVVRAEPVPEPVSPPRAERATVLVVEDEHMVRALLVRVLEKAGHRVLQAATGEEALRTGEAEHVDLVLSDVVMPDVSGLQVVARLRQLRPGLRVLMLSGYAAERVNADELPPDVPLLQKPIAPDALVARVAEALGVPCATTAPQA